MLSVSTIPRYRRLIATLVISLAILGTVAVLSVHNIRQVKATDSTMNVNQQASFESITFNTTGTLTYNSTAITGGSLRLKATDGTIIVTTRYTINAQKANSNIVRFLLFAHVNDSSNIEVAAYVYINVSNGSVNAYFGARNADFFQSGTVSFLDYSHFSAHEGYCSGNSEYAPETDLNASGCTDIIDVGIMNVVYGHPAYR